MTIWNRDFLYTLPRNIARSFWGRNLLWHLLAIGITYAIVISGFDWKYFEASRPFSGYLFPAVILGWLVPMIFPAALFLAGLALRDRRAVFAAYATAQAAIIGLFTASFYKAFTGRPGPGHQIGRLVNTSREFRFGFLRGGVFFGWPSSHTTIAFAMMVALRSLYSENKTIRRAALIYAIYIGVGVSMTIHWFSDFAAGVIIGSVIGTTVGNAFNKSLIEGQKLTCPPTGNNPIF